jgi:hypothetical protein
MIPNHIESIIAKHSIVYIYVCMYACMHVCMYVCMCALGYENNHILLR